MNVAPGKCSGPHEQATKPESAHCSTHERGAKAPRRGASSGLARTALGPLVLTLCAAFFACGTSGDDPAPNPSPPPAATSARSTASPSPPPRAAKRAKRPRAAQQKAQPRAPLAELGEGFAVWESSRSGTWRIWYRDFASGQPRQLSPDEPRRQHCCPHIAPDGHAVAYLSLPPGQESYPQEGATGELRLIAPAGGPPRTVAPAARTYFEHRAVVWRSPGQLIYIDGSGRSQLRDLAQGSETPLTDEALPHHGWLIDASLRYATQGTPTFSPYERNRRRVRPARAFGGCQPYFSHNGRWGFWVAGAGGPINRIDLATRATTTLVAKSDPRLPPDRGYLYFPMLSRDGQLLAWGASPGEHDHQRADYDIFVAETDPDTLELLGPPLRVTEDRATDRFPDVFHTPLALGRHFGEAPLTATLRAPADAPDALAWTFEGGEGGEGHARGVSLQHTWRRAGTYGVHATGGGETLHGLVRVRPARPPKVVETAQRAERLIVVRFDEPVNVEEARPRLASGAALTGWRAGEDGQSLHIELAAPLTAADTLHLTGVRDRAQQPNAMAAAKLPLAPPRWPADRNGLLFLWETDGRPNQVTDPQSDEPVRCRLTANGQAWLDRHGALVLRGGFFEADWESVERVLLGCQTNNALSIEAVLTPVANGGDGQILSFGSGPRSRNFELLTAGGELVLRLRTPDTGPGADRPQITLGPLPAGRPSHVVITYAPGRLAYYRDGALVMESDRIQGGFFHWKARALLVGDARRPSQPWQGQAEGLALYNRPLDAAEVRENHRRYAAAWAERAAVQALRLRATLTARSAIPTLETIAPYREALAVFAYKVETVLAGSYKEREVRVVHRVLQDGKRLPVANRSPGTTYQLTLEPLAAQPQLESLYLADTLPERYDLPLYYDAAGP